MSKHGISLAVLKDIAKESNITFRAGDILLVRTGWVKWYEEHSEEERVKYVTNGDAWVGVVGSEETLEWLWDNHFAAVAADSIGFEVWPPQQPWQLHDFLLPGWGCPIGEMWDLEALAEQCKKEKRWSFFLTSSPLNTRGGVASPPNALAVF
jgi:kynurenine formamidase